MQSTQNDETLPANQEGVETPSPQQQEYLTASQMHNDHTKPKPNYTRSIIQIIIVLLLLLSIFGILSFVKKS